MTYTTRLPKIAAELDPRLKAAAAEGAALIASRARDRVPVATGRLRDSIHVAPAGEGDYEVKAGNNQVFYGHIVEHGSAHTPAHPFMIPALEESRDEIYALAAAMIKKTRMSTPVRRALYGKLAGDTTLNNLLGTPAAGFAKSIYHQQAPEGAQYPFVIFQKQAGNPTETFGDPSALETDVWMIKGLDRSTGTDTVEAIQARITALLNDAALSVSGSSLLYLRRESDVEYPEVADGVSYKHAGGLYRLITD